MSDSLEEISAPSHERRSSVRVRSLLPISVRPVDANELPALESKIMDMAVLESEGVLHDHGDWTERDDLPKDTVFVLRELRALRQQLTEIQRKVDLGAQEISERWVSLNDKGLRFATDENDPEWKEGQHVEIRLQIPNLQTPEVLAVGEVLRHKGERGVAVVFRYISQSHSKAIIRYALRRERQIARSLRFTFKD